MSIPATGASRRQFVGASAAAAGTTVLWGMAAPNAAAAPPLDGSASWVDRTSENGWPLIDDAQLHLVEGSRVFVKTVDGDAATILLHVIRRFHYEIDTLRAGEVTGYRADRQVSHAYESNYLSGSAVSLRPGSYPTGVKGGMYPHELVVVRDILAELDGAVTWGGDQQVPNESYFGISLPPSHPKVKGVARKIVAWNDDPGKGAGTVDAFDPARRRLARIFSTRSAR